ncbi:antibiotic biosynthesis monooxygenase [Aureimonas sp. SA4125]|uniref:putative quinol monooxygenase n=1 Tax=Aureimonas sp. SA4125 TaxID=2826993 RepID=UPI001CC6E130|nr:putative quinol monooxygenase [Aureimonas sp. SA4125]BDA87092.1 antibiotic biosynthesis monooxygenase [Aureimonas sp. SA4125]
MIYLIATLKIRPGSQAAVVAAATPCIHATRLEPGCLRYDLLASVLDPETLVFVEQWETREALAKHFTMPHLLAWREGLAPHKLEGRIEVVHPERVEQL